jgi:DNA-directed RNA polymerase subunit RPC12/RpoP
METGMTRDRIRCPKCSHILPDHFGKDPNEDTRYICPRCKTWLSNYDLRKKYQKTKYKGVGEQNA